MRKHKTSSGDVCWVHPYLRDLRGQEVECAKIIRKEGKEPKIIKYKKIV